MKTHKNSFLRLAEDSRRELMAGTGMDELDYHLAILEGGCRFLEQLVPERPGLSSEVVRLYREHITSLGYWAWWEYAFRSMEIGLVGLWNSEGSVVPYQDEQWKRAHFLDHVHGMWNNKIAQHQLELWFKAIEPKLVLYPDRQPQPQPQQAHVH